MDCFVQPGKVNEFELQGWSGSRIGAENIKVARLRAVGDLRNPKSWQMEAIADVRGVHFRHDSWQVDHRFDHGQIVAIFRQGVLRVADVSLRSEALSLMGNGVMMTNGRVWSVLRVVAAPDYGFVINRVAVGSQISQGWMSSWLGPMVTRDRLYRDIHLEGSLNRLMADVGRHREELELRTILRMMKSFFAGEVMEEGRKEMEEGKEGVTR